MTTTADHLRNALDGRWRDVKNQVRTELSGEVFRPHYTPNTVIARTKVAEQLKIMAARGAAEDGFKKEHGGNGDVGAAVTQIEMLAMSDLSLMVKAGVQWGLFGGAIENLGTDSGSAAIANPATGLMSPALSTSASAWSWSAGEASPRPISGIGATPMVAAPLPSRRRR